MWYPRHQLSWMISLLAVWAIFLVIFVVNLAYSIPRLKTELYLWVLHRKDLEVYSPNSVFVISLQTSFSSWCPTDTCWIFRKVNRWKKKKKKEWRDQYLMNFLEVLSAFQFELVLHIENFLYGSPSAFVNNVMPTRVQGIGLPWNYTHILLPLLFILNQNVHGKEIKDWTSFSPPFLSLSLTYTHSQFHRECLLFGQICVVDNSRSKARCQSHYPHCYPQASDI